MVCLIIIGIMVDVLDQVFIISFSPVEKELGFVRLQDEVDHTHNE